jgi:hypothetical protein
MFTSTLLSMLLALSASALPTTSISRRDSSANTGLVVRDNWSVTRNDLVNGGCSPVTIIFARGTLELGNVGSLAGPPFFNALTDMIGASNVAVQGVNYGATIIGYLEGGDPAGASTMAALINQAVSQCPSTQIVISGYRYAIPHLYVITANPRPAKELKSHISLLNKYPQRQQHISQQQSSSAIPMTANHFRTLLPAKT